jgi:signal transduction histidine kinase
LDTKLNSNKKLDFIISGAIIVAFIIIIVLVSHNILISFIGFNQDTFVFITTILVILGVIIYLIFSKTLFEPLFESDKQIQDIIKETIHEINTPVATIQLNTKILLKTEKDEKNIQRIQRINQSCQKLIDLYKQMEYNLKKEVNANTTETFEINEIINQSIKEFDDIKKDIKISNKINQDLYIECDKNGFLKVINNIISNAIKYNRPNGSITIELINNILYIRDTGIGISEEMILKVFEKYFQSDKNKKGFGLGLHTVKEFCDKYKIKINIKSQIDEGTSISLNLNKVI